MGVMPFLTAEKALFWALAVHEFKTNPKAPEPRWPKVERPCEYTDIMREAARLRLPQLEMKVVVKYGRLGHPPGRKDPENERAIWQHAMDKLHTRLTAKGIVQSATEMMAAGGVTPHVTP